MKLKGSAEENREEERGNRKNTNKKGEKIRGKENANRKKQGQKMRQTKNVRERQGKR